MKTFKIIFTLLSLLIFPTLSSQTRKNVEANPINVAVSLMHRTDTASMASTCNYYGYTRQSPHAGYTIFSHPNGSIIRYKYTDSSQSFPTVEVTSKVAAKERDQILQNLRFEKVGNVLEQKSIGFSTRCQLGSHGTLILTRHTKLRK